MLNLTEWPSQLARVDSTVKSTQDIILRHTTCVVWQGDPPLTGIEVSELWYRALSRQLSTTCYCSTLVWCGHHWLALKSLSCGTGHPPGDSVPPAIVRITLPIQVISRRSLKTLEYWYIYDPICYLLNSEMPQKSLLLGYFLRHLPNEAPLASWRAFQVTPLIATD